MESQLSARSLVAWISERAVLQGRGYRNPQEAGKVPGTNGLDFCTNGNSPRSFGVNICEVGLCSKVNRHARAHLRAASSSADGRQLFFRGKPRSAAEVHPLFGPLLTPISHQIPQGTNALGQHSRNNCCVRPDACSQSLHRPTDRGILLPFVGRL